MLHFALMLLLLLQYVVVEILLEHGADIEAKTRSGETALGAYYTVTATDSYYTFDVIQSQRRRRV